MASGLKIEVYQSSAEKSTEWILLPGISKILTDK